MTGIKQGGLPPDVRLLGDAALVVEFGGAIDPVTSARVLGAAAQLRVQPLAGVCDVVPAWNTLTVHYDPGAWEAAELARLLHARCRAAPIAEPGGSVIEVPLCYEGAYAPDMETVCVHTGLSAAEVVRRHCAVTYRVCFLGFTPGFPYLGGLDPRLAVPRRATPRTRVPAGSVGIGGQQTGIYPQAAPGGWQLIGRTPLRLFDANAAQPCRLAPGDTLRFVPVRAAEMHAMDGGLGA